MASAVAPAQARDPAPIRLYAANNLKAALGEVVTAYQAETGIRLEAVFASSGLIRDRVNAGEQADIIVAADFEVPESFAADGRSGPVVLFARNQMCALAAPGVSVSPSRLLEVMLNPAIRIGTSTPKADPGGDYVWQAFHKAEKLQPGTFAELERKSTQLIHGPQSPPVPAGSEPMGYWVENGRVDLFLYYCTAAIAAAKRNPTLKVVPFPSELAVIAEYGLTVLHSEPDREARAAQFALYLLSSEAQHTLRKHGFVASGVAQSANIPRTVD
ncbi:MAG TPA: substrate-binding domain-containing protein [Stellaceae bacterium]|nr:substrate-binding domain-containing protein [Stellaceae bacterium]